ncbi:hypothetical protein RQN30_00540 [Arcanobacterium hippocoleae]
MAVEMKLEVGSRVELEIIDVAYGGEFIARYGDAVIFVRGAILGERVIAEITKKQAKLYRAIVRDVLLPAKGRIAHPWHLGTVEATGAADYGHMDLGVQRQMKSLMLQNQLRRIGGEEAESQFSPEMFAVKSAEQGRDGSLREDPKAQGWHYRTRIDVLKLKTGVGMHILRTNKLVPLQEMPLASRRLCDLDLFGDKWDGFVPVKKRIRLVAPSGSDPVAVIDGKVFSAPDMPGNAAIREIVSYRGEQYSYDINAGSFWQIHENAPSALAAHVFDGLEVSKGDTLVDLYSGSGLFSVVGANIVGAAGGVRAFEGDELAVSAAKHNLRMMDWASADTANINAENISELIAGADFVIADPPRAGLGTAAAQILGQSQAKKIALISCDSASMARDISALLKAGRKIESFTAVDIFPNTHYVETVCIVS